MRARSQRKERVGGERGTNSVTAKQMGMNGKEKLQSAVGVQEKSDLLQGPLGSDEA